MEVEMSEKRPMETGEKEEVVKLEEEVWRESKKMWLIAGPAIFTRSTTFGIHFISQAFIGHLSSTKLAAYSLVFTVILRFANGLLAGMASALETLCGQAYGAKQYHMLGIYLQRSWIVLLITSFFLLPVFIFTTQILKALGQDDVIAKEAGTIALWTIPIMFSFISSFTCQMFLQAQSKNLIIAYLAAFSLATHAFLSWLLTVKYKLGIPGAMASTILTYWIPNVGQLMFIMCGKCRETWRGFSFLAFKDLWPVVKLSLSSGVMLCLEIWYITVLILLTGKMKNAEVAIDALSICININGLQMMITLGFLAAVSVRVSNELGRGNSKAAKFSIVVAVVTSLAIGFVLFLFFIFFRGRLAYISTKSSQVVKAVADLSPLLACSILLSSVQPVLSGVAVGAGWQRIVARVNIASYYIIGVPIGIVIGYVVNMQVKGVWLGMLIGIFVQTLVVSIITYRTNWDKQVSIALKRVNKWVVPEPEGPEPSTQAVE